MDEPTRRAWSRPELIVLVRSKPEEAVLNVCTAYLGTGDAGSFEYCSRGTEGHCAQCTSNDFS